MHPLFKLLQDTELHVDRVCHEQNFLLLFDFLSFAIPSFICVDEAW